ncbi:hypothetical protein [Mesorhizobium sp.]|uniref:hypothetical protein n=2 Tax=Mesorhizobium TaxID=68287 RepID=UPI00344B6AC0
MQDAGVEEGGQAVQARQMGVEQHLAEARRLFDQADESPTNPEELLRLEQGFREVLQQAQDGQAASSFFSGPRMPAGPGDLNSIVADAFAATASGHAGVEAAAPPELTASRQQIRPSPDPGQGDHLPTGWVINNEHSAAQLRPAEMQRALNTPQAAVTQQPLSEVGVSGGRVPMHLPMQQLGGWPLEGVPVQGTGSEHIGRLHAEAARSAWPELPAAHSINVSFAVPKGFFHGAQRVPDAMLSFSGRYNLLPDAGKARQVSFEQHGADPLQGEPVASGTRDPFYPHLSDEHLDFIDNVILHGGGQLGFRHGEARRYSAQVTGRNAHAQSWLESQNLPWCRVASDV